MNNDTNNEGVGIDLFLRYLFNGEMQHIKIHSNLLVGCIIFGIYLATIAPGLSWANYGSDGGDLISAAYTGGIPHPTGYPVYIIFAAIFQKLPFGSLAFRTNLLSACAMTLTAILIKNIVERATNNWFSGVVSSFVFAWYPLVWSQAIITEVYGLHSVFFAILIYLLLRPKPVDGKVGFVLGLSIGNHLTSLLLVPGIFLVWLSDWHVGGAGANAKMILASFVNKIKNLGYMFLGMILGLTPYFLLPIRSLSSAPIVWGDSSTLDGFLWMVSGQMYQENLLPISLEFPSDGPLEMIGLSVQFGFLGIPLILAGILPLLRNRSLAWITLTSSIIFSIFSLKYGVVDAHVYLIPVVVVLAIWFGLGVSEIMTIAKRVGMQWVPRLIGIVLILGSISHLIQHWNQVDASRDVRAEEFGMVVLKALPAHALVITNGDRSTFALWYFHFALERRPDIRLVASELISYDWYRNRLQKTYSDISVPQNPDPTWITSFEKENPDRQICHVYYDNEAHVYCGYQNAP